MIRESDLETTCINCGTKHSANFKSVFDEHSNHKHYKVLNCTNCGYEIMFIAKEGQVRLF